MIDISTTRRLTFALVLPLILMVPTLAYAHTDISTCPDNTDIIAGGFEYAMWIQENFANTDGENGNCHIMRWDEETTSAPQGVTDIILQLTGSDRNQLEFITTSGTTYDYFTATGSTFVPHAQFNQGNRGLRFSNGSPDPTVYESNLLNLRSDTFSDDDYIVWGQLGQDVLIYGATGVPTATLTSSGSTLLVVGDSLLFTATAENLNFSPFYLYFFQDANETFAFQIVENFPWSPEYTFSNTYFQTGNFGPFAVFGSVGCDTVTDTGQITGSGCTTLDVLSQSGVTVLSEVQFALDTRFPSTLTGSKIRDVLVLEPVDFTYNIDDPCTVTSRKFFLGYNDNLAFLDSGAVLPIAASGVHETKFPRTNAPYSAFFFPYIELTCSDSPILERLYLGGTWEGNGALGVSVYTQEELDRRAVDIIPQLNGGSTEDFGDGIGARFTSNKNLFDRFETIFFEIEYNVPFAPMDAVFFEGSGATIGKQFGEPGQSLIEGETIRFTHFYERTGFYEPFITIFGPGQLEETFFLGGEDFPNPFYRLYVRPSIFGGVSNLFNTDDGIFGLDPSTFRINFTNSENAFLDDLNDGLNKIMGAGLKVIGVAYNILKQSPILSFFTGIIHPREGATFIFPGSIGPLDIPIAPSQRIYTVRYASPSSGFSVIGDFIAVLIAMSFIWFVLHKFLRPKW